MKRLKSEKNYDHRGIRISLRNDACLFVMCIKIPYKSIEGHEYLFRLNPLEHNLLSNDLKIEVVNVVLEVVNDISEINSIKTLRSLGDIILEYMDSNPNVVLYYICDKSEDIKRRMNKRRSDITPQEYRNMIFSKIFIRTTNNKQHNYIDRPIIVVSENELYYLHLIGRECHRNDMESVENTLRELAS